MHLHCAGLTGHFTHVVTRDDVPRGKPSPDSFLRAAEMLRVPARNCVAIEDSHAGVAAAYAAGMRVVMVAQHVCPKVQRYCTAVVPDLTAVQHVLRGHLPAGDITAQRRAVLAL